MGAEVPPTASPEATNFMTPSPVLPTPSAEHVSSVFILDEKEQELPRMGTLSRKPLDPGTVWTVVNPAAMPTKTLRISRILGSVSGGPEDVDHDHSGEECFCMAKPRYFTNNQWQTLRSPINVNPSTYTTSRKPSSVSQGGPKAADKGLLEDFDAEEDDMFHFEAGSLRSAKATAEPAPRNGRGE